MAWAWCGGGLGQACSLAFLALAVQALFLLETSGELLFRFPLVDAATYHHLARAWANGEPIRGVFWQAPGYPLFLSFVERLCGASAAGARALQALLLAPALSLLVWRLGLRVLSPRWAWGAGAAASLTGPLLFYASQLLPAAPAATLAAAALLLSVRAAERPSAGRWLAAGLALGLATSAVAPCAALAPVFAVAAWVSGGASLRPRAARVAALGAGVCLVVLPIVAHNASAAGRWAGLATSDGVDFYIGNSTAWREALAVQPGLDWDRLVRRPFEQGAGSEVEASRWFRARALREMEEDPAAAVRRCLLKAAVFWHGREIPRNIDLYGWRGASRLLSASVWHAGLYFPIGLLVPLAAVGMVAARRRRAVLFLGAAMLAFGLLVALFFPCSRYRVPVLPPLVVLAAVGAEALAGAWRARRLGLCCGLACCGLVVGVAANVPFGWPTDRVRYDAHLWNAVGAAAAVRSECSTARACYEKALRLDPALADASFNLGVLLERLYDRRGAESCYRAALGVRPDHDRAHLNLALLLVQDKRFDDALGHVVEAERLNPLDADAWYNHAAVLQRAGRLREALEPLRRAASLDAAYRPQLQAFEKGLRVVR